MYRFHEDLYINFFQKNAASNPEDLRVYQFVNDEENQYKCYCYRALLFDVVYIFSKLTIQLVNLTVILNK